MADIAERIRLMMREIQRRADTQLNLAVGVGFLLAVIAIVYFVQKKLRRKAGVPTEPPNLRFRKRDKMIFYGKKMLRKVKQLSQPREEGYRQNIKKRQKIMFNFAKQLLRFEDDEPERKLKEPPRAFLEADITEADVNDMRLPPEVVYMLKSVRVFGHFEKPLSFELCKYIETKFVPANTLLFRPGQTDDNIYVVQSGKLSVCLVEKDGTEMPMKEVGTGDSIYSVLSILDVLSGRQVGIPQISCRAMTDTHVLKLPGKAFQTVFEQYPDSLVRVVQIIMLRLQQVTFMALHNFLGLSYELIDYAQSPSRHPSVSGAPKPGRKSSSTSAASVLKKGKGVSLELDREASNTSSATASPDSGVSLSKASTQDTGPAHESARKSQSVPIPEKKVLRRSVSFTEPEHGTIASQPIGRNKSMIQMSSLWNPDTEDGLAGQTPSDFLAACGRARVVGIPAESPSHKASFDLGGKSDQSEPEGSPVSLDTQFDFPGPPAAEVISKHFLLMNSEEEEQMLKEAAKDITARLELPNDSYLDNMLTLASIPVGTVLIEQGDLECNLYYVLKGSIDILQKSPDGSQHVLFAANAGEFLGGLSVVTGEPSFFTCKATKQCHVAIITKSNFYSIMQQWPRVVLNVAHSLVKYLSPFLRQIDYALDWMHVEAGRAVYRQGEQSDCIYIVLNGRLRSVVALADGKKELVNESGRGELVGVVEVLTQSPRATTVHAIRDTELALLPEGLLNTIKRHFPQVVSHLIRVLGERLLGHYMRGNSRSQPALCENPRPADSNLGTVALIPASDSVPLSNFTFELSLALNCIGPTLLLTSSLIRAKLGSSALNSMNEYRLSSWLGQQEDIHRIVLYQADSFMSAWTKRCIRQADYILIVAVADENPAVNQLETQLENTQVRSQKELVLLHRMENPAPITHTVDWLNARGWISSHHHVRCSKKIFSRRLLADKFRRTMGDYPLPARNSDFARLARRLTGTSIGLVLGGGGARGLSHVGVIKALEEGGIPIDMVGGTSMGSFVGAVLAIDGDVAKTCEKVRDWSWDMTSIFKKLVDLTYPFTSMFSGSGFNASIRSSLGERQIEDLLLPYFCITTDITSSKMRVHTDGSLWRYVRASMSLSGYLPPLCDPKDGHLLLDGGYVNNLPADIMRNRGAKTIIAVDVGSEYTGEMTNYGDDLSGWWLLWNKWNPFAETVRVPDMAEIQSRLAYVSCVQQLEEVKESSYCEYVRPPIERFKTLDFGKFEEIMDVGHRHAKVVFKNWMQGDRPPEVVKDNVSRKQSQLGFTDLAERISRIDNPIVSSHFDWGPSSYVDGLLGGGGAGDPRHLFVYSEDEDDDRPIRYRPRTGSLSEHEDLLALKAQARAIQQMEERNTATSGDEAGYDSDDTHLRRRVGQLIRATSDP